MQKAMIRRFLGGLAVLTLGSGLASASSITWYNNIFFPDNNQPATGSPQGAPAQYQVPFTTTVEVPKFDGSTVAGADATHYGQLTSVQIVLNWILNANVGVVNISPTPHTFINAVANIPVGIVGPDGTTIHDTASATVAGGIAFPGVSFFDTPQGGGSQSNLVIGPGMALYAGGGGTTVGLTFSSNNGTYGGTETGGAGDLFFGGTAQVGASVEVVNNYNLVAAPEPGTFMMFGSALLGVGLFIRRRRS